jgi:hypothetical protein
MANGYFLVEPRRLSNNRKSPRDILLDSGDRKLYGLKLWISFDDIFV